MKDHLKVEKRFIKEAHGRVWLFERDRLWTLERVSRTGRHEIFLVSHYDPASIELIEMYVEDHNDDLQLELPLVA